jgi:hypothetical protein
MSIMNWRLAVYTVASFLLVTLPALAQPSVQAGAGHQVNRRRDRGEGDERRKRGIACRG